MKYNDTYNLLSSGWRKRNSEQTISFSTIDIVECKFKSARRELFNYDHSDSFCTFNDEQITENDFFSYYVFKHNTGKREAIILLHGLNEKDWEKYLPWAFELAQNTGKDVILFPISFHMDRVPNEWKNARAMSQKLSYRKEQYTDVKMASFVNVALSERLTSNPERLFMSGFQSANDIQSLLNSIKSGDNALFRTDTTFDFFSYSIGALLTQILFMANPSGLFSNSKLFMFCGGSVFNHMYGVSKYIMDSVTYERLMSFYGDELVKPSKGNSVLRRFIKNTALGEAFYAFTNLERLSKSSKQALNRMKEQVKVITLLKDKVIPANSIKETLNGFNINYLNPNYNYSHESPFPMFSGEESQEVNTTFKSVMNSASAYLS